MYQIANLHMDVPPSAAVFPIVWSDRHYMLVLVG